MNTAKLLALVDHDHERGTAPWLTALFLELIAEGGTGEGVTADDLRPIVDRFVAMYVRRETVVKFAGLVRDMRKSQREYFNTRVPAWLERVKADESAVDEWVAGALKSVTSQQQPTLFDTTPHRKAYE